MPGLVIDKPNLYLGEICSAIEMITNTEVSPSTVCILLASYWLTCQNFAFQRNVNHRGFFIDNISEMRQDARNKRCSENMSILFVVSELFARNYLSLEGESQL